MSDGRLYRAAFLPFLLALAVAAFSLHPQPGPLTSTLAPDAFEAGPAMAELSELARELPARRPGGDGDARLAAQVAARLRALGGTAGGGFQVRTYSFDAQTVAGERTLENVLAVRPGSTSEAPIVIVAHRDAAGARAAAELSGTAALLELARVFAARETRRTIVLASTSGGSGGFAGAAELASELPSRPDAAIVLGDLAGTRVSQPVVVPFSDGFGSAPALLARTVAGAVSSQASLSGGYPSALAQLVHLAFPLSEGEQGPLQAEGIPAVLVQASGEIAPPPHATVSEARLEGLGRAVLGAVDALDVAGALPRSPQEGIVLQGQEVPGWALRALVIALLLPVLLAGAGGLARMRRERRPMRRWFAWTACCAAPFLLVALFARSVGLLGILHAVPAVPALPSALPAGVGAALALAACFLVFVLAWLGWASFVRARRWGRPDWDAAGLAAALLVAAVALLAWLSNPLSALLAVPAAHVLLGLASPTLRPRRALAVLALLTLAALPLLGVLVFYADQLGAGPAGVLWGSLQLLAGGFVGPFSALLWSAAFGAGAAALLLAVSREVSTPSVLAVQPASQEISIRGPLSYAGPGSLGGTESALRR